jgi:restriction system protein
MTLAALLLSGNRLLSGAAGTLLPLGLVLLAVGAVILYATRSRLKDDANASSPARPHTRPGGAVAERSSVVDATPTELTRVRQRDVERPTRWSAAVFDLIEWRRFEAVVERLFQQAGFETRSRSHGADQGIDIWLYSRSQPGSPVSLVQCKHWTGRRVGVDKIRELRGVMASRSVSRGQFATTSVFTDDAIAFARDNGVNLLDVNRLLELIAKRDPGEQAQLLDVALEGDYWRPTCASCGTKMVERTAKAQGNGFWGCARFPRCRGRLPMRGDRAAESARWR